MSTRDDANTMRSTPESHVSLLTEIYNTHFDFVWRNARRLGVPASSADDIAQEVFVVVHRRLPDFDGRAHVRAWIFGILVRVVRGHRRSFMRKGARCVPLDDALASRADIAVEQGPTPADLTERAERVQLLDRLLGKLDEDKRTVLILTEFEQWTLREIAEALGSNPNTIHSRLRAARRAFQKLHSSWLASQGDRP